MTVIAAKYIPSVDWPKWMQSFSAGVTNKTYNKMEYQLWKKCNRTGEAVNVALTDLPSIRLTIGDRLIEVFRTRDKSFGAFLFNHMFNEEERAMATYSNATVNSIVFDSSCAEKATISIDTSDYLSTSNQYDNRTSTSTAANNEVCSYYTHDFLSIIETIEKLEDRVNNLEHKNDKEESKNMKNFNFDFGPCTNDQCRVSMYGIAVKNAAGVYVSYNPDTKEIVDVDILNFEGAKYMYKIPVALNDVAVGDVIIHNRKPMFVIGLNTDGSNNLTCIDVCAGEQKTIVPTVNMFGFNFITKIVSLFNMMGNGTPSPEHPFGNMLPFMLMGDNKDIDPMMLMMMMNGNAAMNNPAMLYLMIKDNKDIDPMMFMFMSGAFNNPQPHVCNCANSKG